MDRADELNAKFDEIENIIKYARKTTHQEHWKAVEQYIKRAAFIVWNFDQPLEKLEAELDRQYQGKVEFEAFLDRIKTETSVEND